jgi:hypothetical protein
MAAAKRGNPAAREDKENARIASDAASAYVKDKGYSESSLEAVQRAAKANKRRSRVRVGGHEGEV